MLHLYLIQLKPPRGVTTYEVHLARPWWAMPLLFGEYVHVTYSPKTLLTKPQAAGHRRSTEGPTEGPTEGRLQVAQRALKGLRSLQTSTSSELEGFANFSCDHTLPHSLQKQPAVLCETCARLNDRYSTC
jgi:hypothetical protein